MTRAPGPRDAAEVLRATRLIGLALGTGVTAFALVTWYLQRQAPLPTQQPWLLHVWIVSALCLAALALMLWRTKVAPLVEVAPVPGSEVIRARGIQTGTVTTWALVESAALFGVVLYLLDGHVLAGLVGVFMIWAAVTLAWPRPEWLATGQPAGR
jgi:hypothetical protein